MAELLHGGDMEAEKLDTALGRCVMQQGTWEQLPEDIKRALDGSKERWKQWVLNFSLKHQLRWRDTLIRSLISDERLYYQEIVRISRINCLSYPYHIADVLVKGLRTTAVKYYLDTLHDSVQSDRTLDKIPPLTWVDCCRLLGVSSEKLIEMINKCKSRVESTVWKGEKVVLQDLIPHEAGSCENSAPWWLLRVGFVSENDVKKCSADEHALIDSLILRGPIPTSQLDSRIYSSLFIKGLVYFDVPIHQDDIIWIARKRSIHPAEYPQGSHEYLLVRLEGYLGDKKETVARIASALDTHIFLLEKAVSFFCRLGIVQKSMEQISGTEEEILVPEPLGTPFPALNASQPRNEHVPQVIKEKEVEAHQEEEQSKEEEMEAEETLVEKQREIRTKEEMDEIAITKVLAEIREISRQSKEKEELDDEKLWGILNFIENWQRTTDTSSIHYQKILIEVKTTLLPLIPTASKTTTSQEDQENLEPPLNELARIDDDFKLSLNESNMDQVLLSSSKQLIANVISVCGDTHVGKSTIISSLLELGGGTTPRPTVADPHQSSPTTANVQFYDSFTIENLATVRFLDLEGENGGKPPKNTISAKIESLLQMIGVSEYQERRRRAVSENMPRLAFVTSDIVLFIGNESFANANYMKRVRRLVFDATESVDSASSPVLILVYNKCGLDEEFDIENCTSQFLENVENAEMKRLYSDVICVCMPHLDQAKKVRCPGKPTLLIDGEEIYNLQIQKLQKMMIQILSQRMAMREQQGILYSDFVWCLLFKQVVKNFDRKLRMGELLCSIIKPKEPLSAKAVDFFGAVYKLQSHFTTATFLRCRESAIRMFACLFVDNIKKKQEEYGKYIQNSIKSKSFKEEVHRSFEELYHHFRNLEPCDAVYPGTESAPVMCTTERVCHGLYHRSSERVFGPSADPSSVGRSWQNMKAWFKVGYRPVWLGTHQFQYPQTYAEELNKLINTIIHLAKLMPSNYFLTRISILHQSLQGAKMSSSPKMTAIRPHSNSSVCPLCLTNFPDRILLPCKHSLCLQCLNRLEAVQKDQVAISLEMLSIEGSGEGAQFASDNVPIGPDLCPACGVKYTKVVESMKKEEGMRNRFISILTAY